MVTSKNNRGKTIKHTSKEEIEEAIITSNERKYHQTEGGSQLLDPPFISKLGKHGEGLETENVLNGDFVFPPNTSDATKDFLNACKIHPLTETTTDSGNLRKKYKATLHSWKIRREKTCSYNQHIGHYKVAMKDKFLSCFFFREEKYQ